jgi:hypothetical protein
MADRTISRPRKAQSRVPVQTAGAADAAAVIPLASRRVVELVRSQPDRDTIELLTELLGLAQAGAISGLAVVSLHAPGKSDRKMSVSLTGLAKSNPTLTAGAMSVGKLMVEELALKDAGVS